jgi:hypothetical protein
VVLNDDGVKFSVVDDNVYHEDVDFYAGVLQLKQKVIEVG